MAADCITGPRPMSKLAKDFDISDAALAKRCRCGRSRTRARPVGAQGRGPGASPETVAKVPYSRERREHSDAVCKSCSANAKGDYA